MIIGKLIFNQTWMKQGLGTLKSKVKFVLGFFQNYLKVLLFLQMKNRKLYIDFWVRRRQVIGLTPSTRRHKTPQIA
jgi:hypothetical protein